MYDLSQISGQTAMITGASTGIGAEFARRLAEHGANLVLVARSIDKLEAAAKALRLTYGVDVVALEHDLAEPDASKRLFDRVSELGLSVDVLINNAGIDWTGPSTELDPDHAAKLIAVNIKAVQENTGRFLPAMVARRRGTIINVASTAAFQAAPYMATYAASKSFVLSFTQAVGAENTHTNVRVLALCPGPTETPMMSGRESPLGKMRTPEQVVTTAFKALGTRKSSVVDGRLNAFFARVVSRLPESMLLAMGRRMMERNAAAR